MIRRLLDWLFPVTVGRIVADALLVGEETGRNIGWSEGHKAGYAEGYRDATDDDGLGDLYG